MSRQSLVLLCVIGTCVAPPPLFLATPSKTTSTPTLQTKIHPFPPSLVAPSAQPAITLWGVPLPLVARDRQADQRQGGRGGGAKKNEDQLDVSDCTSASTRRIRTGAKYSAGNSASIRSRVSTKISATANLSSSTDRHVRIRSGHALFSLRVGGVQGPVTA